MSSRAGSESPRASASSLAGATLTGIGLGPGDPELLTIKGLRALEAADVVFVTVRRAGETSYAREIAGELIDAAHQEVITVPFPEAWGEPWDVRCQTIVETLAGGRRGVFLTEGDPSLYSTWGHVRETLQSLAPELRVEVVPGIPSPTAAAAAAGLSLADYGERVAIVPALQNLDRLEETLRSFDCVVLIKVGSVLGPTLDILDRLNLLDRTVYVRRCGRPEQDVVRDLRSLRAHPPRDYFALLIVRRDG